MPRLLILIQNLAGGGAERVVSRLSAAFAAQGVACHIAVAEPKVAYAIDPQVQVHFPPNTPGWGHIPGLVRRLQPTTVLSFMPAANAVNIAGRRLVPGWPRAVVSERVALSNVRDFKSATKMLVRKLYRFSDAIVAVSRGVADDLLAIGIPNKLVSVIENPVDVAAITAQASREADHPWVADPDPLLIAAGRLHPDKGFGDLLVALSRLESKTARLLIMGAGPLECALRAETARLGLSSRVAFTGFSANPFALISRATLFVLPSLQEGFPNALLEALALGMPSIATDCPHGPRELLLGGTTPAGVLVPVANSAALANAIDRLLADPEERLRLSSAAHTRAEAFSPSSIVARWHEVLFP